MFQVVREVYCSPNSWETRSYSSTARNCCRRSRDYWITTTVPLCRCRSTSGLVTTPNNCRSMPRRRITSAARSRRRRTILDRSWAGNSSIRLSTTFGHPRSRVASRPRKWSTNSRLSPTNSRSIYRMLKGPGPYSSRCPRNTDFDWCESRQMRRLEFGAGSCNDFFYNFHSSFGM